MFGIVLTLVAVLLVVILAFCGSEEDFRKGESLPETLVRSSFRYPKKKS